jgi:hypothetical protein
VQETVSQNLAVAEALRRGMPIQLTSKTGSFAKPDWLAIAGDGFKVGSYDGLGQFSFMSVEPGILANGINYGLVANFAKLSPKVLLSNMSELIKPREFDRFNNPQHH